MMDQRPTKYSRIPIGSMGIVLGNASEWRLSSFAKYGSCGVRAISGVDTADDWELLLDQLTAALSEHLPDCVMHRSPGTIDAHADWQIEREHADGFRLVLEVVASKRVGAAHIDVQRFVKCPRSKTLKYAIWSLPLWMMLGGVGVVSSISSLLGIGIITCVGSLIVICTGMTTTPFQNVTPAVDSQSQSMLLSANAAVKSTSERLA